MKPYLLSLLNISFSSFFFLSLAYAHVNTFYVELGRELINFVLFCIQILYATVAYVCTFFVNTTECCENFWFIVKTNMNGEHNLNSILSNFTHFTWQDYFEQHANLKYDVNVSFSLRPHSPLSSYCRATKHLDPPVVRSRQLQELICPNFTMHCCCRVNLLRTAELWCCLIDWMVKWNLPRMRSAHSEGALCQLA